MFSALLVREALTLRLSDSLFVYRFRCAVLASVPMALIDINIAGQYQLHVPYSIWIWRVLLTGLVVALVKRRATGPMFGGKR